MNFWSLSWLMVMWKMSNPSGLDVDCLDFMVSFEYFAGNRTYPLPRHFERWFSFSHHKSMGFQQKPMGFQQESMGFHQIMILNQKETHWDRIQLLNFLATLENNIELNHIPEKVVDFHCRFCKRFQTVFFDDHLLTTRQNSVLPETQRLLILSYSLSRRGLQSKRCQPSWFLWGGWWLDVVSG